MEYIKNERVKNYKSQSEISGWLLRPVLDRSENVINLDMCKVNIQIYLNYKEVNCRNSQSPKTSKL